MKSSIMIRSFRRDNAAIAERRNKGFSIVELLVVLGIIALISAISVPYLINYRKVYRSDDQTQRVMDLMREANQLALTKRRTFRFQIDLTQNAVLIIDENGTTQGNLIKKVRMEATQEIRMDSIPTGVTRPNPPNYNNAVFATDTLGHREGATTVIGNNVWMARFRRDGSVVDANNNLLSANIYVWPPVAFGNPNPRNLKEVRVITLFGGSGAIRHWKHNGSTFVAN